MDFIPPNASAQKPLGYCQVVGVAAAQTLNQLAITGGFANGVPEGTCYVVIKAATQAIRYRDDGIAPTAALGYPVVAGVELVYMASTLGALRIIEQLPSATLDILFYGKA